MIIMIFCFFMTWVIGVVFWNILFCKYLIIWYAFSRFVRLCLQILLLRKFCFYLELILSMCLDWPSRHNSYLISCHNVRLTLNLRRYKLRLWIAACLKEKIIRTQTHLIQEYNKNCTCMCRPSNNLTLKTLCFSSLPIIPCMYLVYYLVGQLGFETGILFFVGWSFIQGIWLEWNKECKSSYFKTHDFYRFRFDMRTWLVNKAIKYKIFFCGMIFYWRDLARVK